MCDCCDELRKDLERQIWPYRQDVVATQIERIERLEQAVESLEAENRQQHQKNQRLEEELEMMGILDDGETSTPKKREIALRRALTNRAERNDGRAQMTYRDVMNTLTDMNHESVYPQQCYRAMKAVGNTDGFDYTDSTGGDKVIRVDLDETPLTFSVSINSVNNAEGRSPPVGDGSNGGEHNSG